MLFQRHICTVGTNGRGPQTVSVFSNIKRFGRYNISDILMWAISAIESACDAIKRK